MWQCLLCGTREIQCVAEFFLAQQFNGKSIDVAVKYNALEVGQTHSSEEAIEQN